MIKKKKYSVWVYVLNILVAILIAAAGVYVFIEKKMIISGKYSGGLYYLSDLESILDSVSLFMTSLFIILALFQNKLIKKVREWILMLAILLFLASSFV